MSETAHDAATRSHDAVRRRGRALEAWRLFVGQGWSNAGAVAALFVTLLILAAAVFAPYVAPTDPYDLARLSIMDSRLPPGAAALNGDVRLLGTDGVGRDMLSAMLYGLRLSIIVAVCSTAIAVVTGAGVGLVAAYFGGVVDAFIMRIVDIKLGFPSILIALILLAIVGPGVDKIIVAIAVAQWAIYVRIMRSSALIEREREYILACRGLRLGTAVILFRHLLPNCLPPLIVVATVQVANAVAIEATLSFLGLGLPPTEPSLGLLIANGFEYLLIGEWWISLSPGIVLLVTILCINLVGDRIREILNPKLRH
jgi:peptide/nickel transport system permease protein